MSVVPELIEVEVVWLQNLIEVNAGNADLDLLHQVLAAKEEGMAAIKALSDKQQVARAKAEAGEETAEESSGGGAGDSFRDADMAIEDRLAVAKGKDKFTQLWAAMAQTDCTACGYDCEGYAQAIADGEDTDLSKCVPGEDATANALKQIAG